MTSTTATVAPLSLIAARINRGDRIDLAGYGEFTAPVDTAALTAGRIKIEFTDGTVASIAPHRYVEVLPA